MSISISGLRATDPTTGQFLPSTHVFSVAAALRETCEQLFFDRLWTLLHSMDAHALGISPLEYERPSARIRALAVLVTTLHRQREHTFTSADLGYDITLLDGGSPDGADPALLVQITGEQADQLYLPAVIAADLAQPYSWWNNSEGPEDISDAQFVLREKHWEHALTSRDATYTFDLSPAQAGLTITHPHRMQIILELSARYRAEQEHKGHQTS